VTLDLQICRTPSPPVSTTLLSPNHPMSEPPQDPANLPSTLTQPMLTSGLDRTAWPPPPAAPVAPPLVYPDLQSSFGGSLVLNGFPSPFSRPDAPQARTVRGSSAGPPNPSAVACFAAVSWVAHLCNPQEQGPSLPGGGGGGWGAPAHTPWCTPPRSRPTPPAPRSLLQAKDCVRCNGSAFISITQTAMKTVPSVFFSPGIRQCGDGMLYV